MNKELIAAIADPNRLQILELLRERPLAVQEMTGHLPVSQPQVSKHLRVLSKAGLIKVYPVAQQRYYGIDPTGIKELFSWVESFKPLWDTKSEIANVYLEAVRAKQALIPTVVKPFTIERIISSPRKLVWEALTVPVLLSQWFAPDYFTVPMCELDVRPGGIIKLTMQAPDGTYYPMTGMYQEVVAENMLRSIQSPLDENGKPLFDLDLTIHLSDEGNNTKITVIASALVTSPKAAPHLAGLQPGWEQNLSNLERMLSPLSKEVNM